MKDLIEQLKKNEKPYCRLPVELRDKLKELNDGTCIECMQSTSKVGTEEWRLCRRDIDFEMNGAGIFRLRADYTEQVEDEYETLEIEKGVHGLMIRKPTSIVYLHELIDDPNFAGYQVDGKIFGRLYKNKKAGTHCVIIDAALLDKYEVCDMIGAQVMFKE